MSSYIPVRVDSQHGESVMGNFHSRNGSLDSSSSAEHHEHVIPENGEIAAENRQSPLSAYLVDDYERKDEETRSGHIGRMVAKCWGIVSFAWMRYLLATGNSRRLEPEDLYELSKGDHANDVFGSFTKAWREELRDCQAHDRSFQSASSLSSSGMMGGTRTKHAPSLSRVLFRAFGGPFILAGGLKLIHDTLLFSGPYLLNKTIIFLGDPSQPMSTGFLLVLAFILTQTLMSLCLRQYFWWCYRVGMRLRSAVITSVFVKSTAISMGVMSRHSVGEITNLMSVDSTRMQDLTPYLHACWYSFYQLGIALYFLSQQLGWSTIAAVIVVLAMIPVTKLISSRMKEIQNNVSKLRDERVKVTNEVLTGMKVIKMQAWESQFIEKLKQIRKNEMAEQLRYAKTQALSGFIFSSIPQLVAVVTFLVYIMLGNQLDVATALTSFALFDLLRFPLFMLPTVINNIVEASVTVERIKKFLLEPEMMQLTSHPLPKGEVGILLDSATTIWEGAGKKYPWSRLSQNDSQKRDRVEHDRNKIDSNQYLSRNLSNSFEFLVNLTQGLHMPRSRQESAQTQMTPLHRHQQREETEGSSEESAEDQESYWLEYSDAEYEAMITQSIAIESEQKIKELEQQIHLLNNSGDVGAGSHQLRNQEDQIGRKQNLQQSILTLSRIKLRLLASQVIAIVGHVGCGKSSLLSTVLGDLRIVHGTVARQGRLAYVAQKPFIANTTLRENILFGLPFEEEKYRDAVFCCCLGPDLDILPGGDLTEIGERGINLSGGQKARVALARAVYADADIYLLDDPLAAVDSHVGLHIFKHCILRLQEARKAVLLVTNALHLLQRCSTIIMMSDGKVTSSGTFEGLMRSDRRFRDMFVTYMESSADAITILGDNQNASHELGVNETAKQEAETFDRQLLSKNHSGADIQSSDATKKNANIPTNELASNSVGTLFREEEREYGDVSLRVYTAWGNAAGGITAMCQIIFLLLLGEGVATLTSWWLTYWSEHGEHSKTSQSFFLAIYASLNAVTAIYFGGRDLFFRVHAWKAGVSLFTSLLSGVMYAPMAFYDTTPLGRMLNRFSKDTYSVDEQIPNTIRWYISSLARVTSAIVYICIVTPMFILALIPIILAYLSAQRYYIKTSRELSRLDSISRSPIYALFSETLDGLTTIRAFGSEKRLINKSFHLLDKQQQAYFLVFSANCWLGIRLELVGTLIVTLSALFAVLARGDAASQSNSIGNGVSSGGQFAGLAGLSISFALSITQSLNWSVRMASDLESQMVSVERITEYACMDQERPHHFPSDSRDSRFESEKWPHAGRVIFANVSMRYRPGLPLVLRSVNLTIKAGERVGIVGRTGSGKSSLISCLLRLVELEQDSGGKVYIDGVDIAGIGINLLRSAVAVIAQDPVLFSGTLRTNLDPFHQYNDNQLDDCVQRTLSLLNKQALSLDTVVEENGANFSVGQRQLICIARALLCGCKVVILDEATAAVDVETDALIQKYIREGFRDATVLTIAHRLNTIMDSDRVLVMDNGCVAEFDTPKALREDRNSIFSHLVNAWEETNFK